MVLRISAILKVTGHAGTIAQAGDLRYPSELEAHDNWQFSLLTATERQQLKGKNRRIFAARPKEKIARVPAQRVLVRDAAGVLRQRGTGTITQQYLTQLDALEAQGYHLYQRIVVGRKVLVDNHGFKLSAPRGTINPATFATRIHAQELGWTSSLSPKQGRLILSRVMRESIRGHDLTHRAVRTMTMTSKKKVSRPIAAHNLVLAPAPYILERIRRAGQPVDAVMEMAARRAMEKMERRIGAKITAICSTHLQDSTGIRPHLHLRLGAYDSLGRYIKLFDRKGGGGGGGRCLLQPEVERQIVKIIERCEPRERN
jgi:hypothetical protein